MILLGYFSYSYEIFVGDWFTVGFLVATLLVAISFLLTTQRALHEVFYLPTSCNRDRALRYLEEAGKIFLLVFLKLCMSNWRHSHTGGISVVIGNYGNHSTLYRSPMGTWEQTRDYKSETEERTDMKASEIQSAELSGKAERGWVPLFKR